MLHKSRFLLLAAIAASVIGSPACLRGQASSTPVLATNRSIAPAITSKVVVYKEIDGRSLHLYIRSPQSMSSTAVPAIIFFHGGGWVGGKPSLFDPQSNYFAARGLVTIEVEYRLLQRGSTQAPEICVEDARSAVRYVRAHAKALDIDPNRIVESGGSAGGYLAAFLSMVPGWNDPHG